MFLHVSVILFTGGSPAPHPGGRLRCLARGGSPGSPHPGGGSPGPHLAWGVYPSMHWGKPLPPADGYCCGRYASYWNAFLFGIIFAENCMKIIISGLGGGAFLVPPSPPLRQSTFRWVLWKINFLFISLVINEIFDKGLISLKDLIPLY